MIFLYNKKNISLKKDLLKKVYTTHICITSLVENLDEPQKFDTGIYPILQYKGNSLRIIHNYYK